MPPRYYSVEFSARRVRADFFAPSAQPAVFAPNFLPEMGVGFGFKGIKPEGVP